MDSSRRAGLTKFFPLAPPMRIDHATASAGATPYPPKAVATPCPEERFQRSTARDLAPNIRASTVARRIAPTEGATPGSVKAREPMRHAVAHVISYEIDARGGAVLLRHPAMISRATSRYAGGIRGSLQHSPRGDDRARASTARRPRPDSSSRSRSTRANATGVERAVAGDRGGRGKRELGKTSAASGQVLHVQRIFFGSFERSRGCPGGPRCPCRPSWARDERKGCGNLGWPRASAAKRVSKVPWRWPPEQLRRVDRAAAADRHDAHPAWRFQNGA